MSTRLKTTAWLYLLAALFLAPAPVLSQGGARAAIERLEGCSKEERRSGCVKILKKRAAGDGREEVKAQVRGGRIIWYEYNRNSGRARRLN